MENNQILIKNATIINPFSSPQKKDIWIKDGILYQIADYIDEKEVEQNKDLKVIYCSKDMMVGPGLVDVHVHFRDPGFTYKEDIETGALAAAAGGFTSVVLMANTKPPVDNADTLRYVLDKGKKTPIRVYSCACITKGMKGLELTDMDGLKKEGAAGFTDDGIPIVSECLVKEAMIKAAELDMPLSFHEENPAYIENNGINHGKASSYYQIGGSDRQAEISLVERDLQLALLTGAPFNVQHISAKESVELVRKAKKKALEKGKNHIHAEACPHHFSLTEEAAMQYGTMAKMNPPLRSEEDRQAILQGLQDGSIDMIATDHAPHSAEEKAKPITEAPSGIIGLETAFALAITNLVKPGILTLPQLFERMSLAPAQFYHFDAGKIEEGRPADLILFEKDAKVTFDSFVSKSSNSPFLGKTLLGKINMTICGGQIAYTNEK